MNCLFSAGTRAEPTAGDADARGGIQLFQQQEKLSQFKGIRRRSRREKKCRQSKRLLRKGKAPSIHSRVPVGSNVMCCCLRHDPL